MTFLSTDFTAILAETDRVVQEGSNLATYTKYAPRVADVIESGSVTYKASTTEGMQEAVVRGTENGNITKRTRKPGYASMFENIEYSISTGISTKAWAEARGNDTKQGEIVAKEAFRALDSMYYTAEVIAHQPYNQARVTTAGSNGLAFACPDGKALIASDHAFKSGGTFSNELGVVDASIDLLDSVEAFGANFVGGDGKKMPIEYRRILVKKGGKAHQQFKRLLNPMGVKEQFETNDPQKVNTYVYDGWILEATPYIDDEKDYFFTVDWDDVNAVTINSENPIFLDHFAKPYVVGVPQYDTDTGEMVTMYNGLLKVGIREIPFTILGGKTT